MPLKPELTRNMRRLIRLAPPVSEKVAVKALSPSRSPLLEGNPHVTKVRKLRKRDFIGMSRMVGELRERRYDAIIDFQGLMKSAAIAGLSGATTVIGFDIAALREKLAAAAYDRAVAVPLTAHVVEQNLALTHAAGATEDVFEFALPAGVAPAAGTRLRSSTRVSPPQVITCGSRPPGRFRRTETR